MNGFSSAAGLPAGFSDDTDDPWFGPPSSPLSSPPGFPGFSGFSDDDPVRVVLSVSSVSPPLDATRVFLFVARCGRAGPRARNLALATLYEADRAAGLFLQDVWDEPGFVAGAFLADAGFTFARFQAALGLGGGGQWLSPRFPGFSHDAAVLDVEGARAAAAELERTEPGDRSLGNRLFRIFNRF